MNNIVDFEAYRNKRKEEAIKDFENNKSEALMALTSKEQFRRYDSEDR